MKTREPDTVMVTVKPREGKMIPTPQEFKQRKGVGEVSPHGMWLHRL